MTKNRARIRATKELAQTEDLRHPDASYLADHRKLRLPDGTIHDFATGPLRFLGLPGNGQGDAVGSAVREARSKGWRIDSNAPGPWLQTVLGDPRPGLLVLHAQQPEIGTQPNPTVAEIEAGQHRHRNIIIVREPRPGEHLQDPVTGRNVYFRSEKPEHRAQAAPSAVEKTKARIAFALRFADLLDAGADTASALKSVALVLEEFEAPAFGAIADAAGSAAELLRTGYSLPEAMRQTSLGAAAGDHVVVVVTAAGPGGKLIPALRAAAATLEADLRIGLIG